MQKLKYTTFVLFQILRNNLNVQDRNTNQNDIFKYQEYSLNHR